MQHATPPLRTAQLPEELKSAMGSTSPTRFRNSPANVVSPTLLQFVLLSMLLHLLLVLFFGTTQSGSSRRGDGWLGPLDVTLRQLSPERGSGFTWAPGADTDLPGTAVLRRLDGSTTAPPSTQPQEKTAAPVVPQEPPRTVPSEPVPPPVPASTDASESVPEVSLSRRPLPAESLPRFDRNAPEEVDKPLIPPAIPTPPISPPRTEKEIVPPVVTPPREVPMPPMAPIAPIERVAPRTARAATRPASGTSSARGSDCPARSACGIEGSRRTGARRAACGTGRSRENRTGAIARDRSETHVAPGACGAERSAENRTKFRAARGNRRTGARHAGP